MDGSSVKKKYKTKAEGRCEVMKPDPGNPSCFWLGI